jgi:hypothetical protein
LTRAASDDEQKRSRGCTGSASRRWADLAARVSAAPSSELIDPLPEWPWEAGGGDGESFNDDVPVKAWARDVVPIDLVEHTILETLDPRPRDPRRQQPDQPLPTRQLVDTALVSWARICDAHAKEERRRMPVDEPALDAVSECPANENHDASVAERCGEGFCLALTCPVL